jgi:endoglucanase
MISWVLGLLLVCALPAAARPPDHQVALLRRGVNITGWFRFPASLAPDALAGWMTDAAMADLRRAGFTFVRLALDPALLDAPRVRETAVTAIVRLQKQGLAVIVSPHPNGWHLETDAADRGRLKAFWRAMGLALRRCDPLLTIPEILNEPVFPGDPTGWAGLQHAILSDIRAALPASTVVLTGQDWGSIAGLLAVNPEADPNVVYSFHFYDPAELTALAAYKPDLERAALARLPFPVDSLADCLSTARWTSHLATADMIRFYCVSKWDRDAIVQRVTAARSWARDHDAVLIAGEFGATNALNDAARLGWLSTARRAFEAAEIGWALWGYDDIMGFALQRPPQGRPLLNKNVLGALGLRPRPE